MKAIKALKVLGPIDAKSIRRDSLLGWMFALPLLFAFVIRWGLPPLTSWIYDNFSFSLENYYQLIFSLFMVFQIPMIFGCVIGFLLLDERDDRTLSALQVTPLTASGYAIYRISIPMIISVVMSMVFLPIANILSPSYLYVLPIVILASLGAPILAIFLVSFAENKVAGFALMKGMGMVLAAPLAAFFLKMPWQLFAGIFPSYWPAKAFWVLIDNEPGFWFYLLMGAAYHLVILFWLVRRFNSVLRRA